MRRTPAPDKRAGQPSGSGSGQDKRDKDGLSTPQSLMPKLDSTDQRILDLLQEDDRLPVSEMSKSIGMPASTLNDRIKRLVKLGIISGFHARIGPEAVGLNLLAFMLVAWSDPKVEPVFLKRVKASPAVLECHHVTGGWNYLLKVRVATTRDLEKFLSETVKAVAGVERTETLIALSSAKETWKLDTAKLLGNS